MPLLIAKKRLASLKLLCYNTLIEKEMSSNFSLYYSQF